MITVALIDDHLIVRSGFAQLLGLEPDLQVVAEFGSGREALTGLPGRGVQVCICDISMPDISGLELLSQLPKGMATIMLSVHDSPALIEQALNAGARGFLSKRCSPDELIAAVHTVATGGCYLTPDIAIKLASGRQDPLTKRERQVAEKLAQGMAVKEIAAELGLSPKTVHVHRANLMENWASATTLNWRGACLMAGDEDIFLPLEYCSFLLFYLLCRMVLPVEYQPAPGCTTGSGGIAVSVRSATGADVAMPAQILAGADGRRMAADLLADAGGWVNA